MKKLFFLLISLLIILVVVRALVTKHPPLKGQAQQPIVTPTIIEKESGTVKLIKNITAKEDLLGLAASPDEKFLYLTSFDENKIYVIDTRIDEIVQTIKTNVGAYGIVYLDSKKEMAISTGSDQVVVLDAGTGKELFSIKVGQKPLDLLKSLDGKYLFTANSMSDTVSVVDIAGKKTIRTIHVGRTPERLSLSTNGQWLFVNNFTSHDISVISTQSLSLATTFKIPGNPTALVDSAKNQSIYLLDSWTNNLIILNNQDFSVEERIPVDELPVDAALSPSGKRLYVLSFAKNSLSVINLKEKRVENKINFTSGFLSETGLNRLKILPNLQKIYITNTNFGKIIALSTR